MSRGGARKQGRTWPWTARIRRFPPARAGASTRAARRWGYVKAQRRRGRAGPHRSRGRAEIRRATQALAEMRGAARVAVAASPRIQATTVSSPASPLCFPLLIKPGLGFCRSISRPIPSRSQFPARFPLAPRIPACPARVPARHLCMAPASSSRTPSGRLSTPRWTPCA